MSESGTCSDSSLVAGEPLAGTATVATDWLLVEVRGAWGRDAVADSGLAAPVREALERFPGKVVLIRRPDRRSGVTVIRAHAGERGPVARRFVLETLAQLPAIDVAPVESGAGEPVAGPIVLVCAHGRRDACCARLGVPLFDALARSVPPEALWQASHLGGHRFAPNLLVLPHGIQLGRIPLGRVAEVIALLAADRIPLDLYRGRTIYSPPVQAAEVAVRTSTACDRIADLELVEHEGDRVTFATTTAGNHTARVVKRPGPVLPASCGADPEPTTIWAASLDGRADSIV